MLIESIYLFFSCLLAATIIPFSSEALLVGAIELVGMDIIVAVIVATVGNVAGTIINYLIGRFGAAWLTSKFGMKEEALENWHMRFEKYDKWLWAANWMPFIGDPITVYAGIIKLNFKEFLLWIVPLRAARYIVVIYFWDSLFANWLS